MAKRRSKLKVNSGSTKRATNQASKAGSPKFKAIGWKGSRMARRKGSSKRSSSKKPKSTGGIPKQEKGLFSTSSPDF